MRSCFTQVTLTLTYDGQQLRLYRNELVDLLIDVEGLTSVSSWHPPNPRLCTWRHVLNTDEVRLLTTTNFDSLTSDIETLYAQQASHNIFMT